MALLLCAGVDDGKSLRPHSAIRTQAWIVAAHSRDCFFT
jgi:hypothetical protein